MIEDTRIWMYRKGEARLFGHPDAVPADQSWQRFPVPESGETTALPVAHDSITCNRKRKKSRKTPDGDSA